MTNFKYDEIKQDAIDKLKEGLGNGECGCDLHNELFNMDYYIIGRHDAQLWLDKDVFEAIEVIREYEQDNFGEVSTDLSEPEKVVNMYVYIIGEQVLSESEHLQECWDRMLEQEDIDIIIQELI